MTAEKKENLELKITQLDGKEPYDGQAKMVKELGLMIGYSTIALIEAIENLKTVIQVKE
jgi:predicted O-methyltransferase YrrM